MRNSKIQTGRTKVVPDFILPTPKNKRNKNSLKLLSSRYPQKCSQLISIPLHPHHFDFFPSLSKQYSFVDYPKAKLLSINGEQDWGNASTNHHI